MPDQVIMYIVDSFGHDDTTGENLLKRAMDASTDELFDVILRSSESQTFSANVIPATRPPRWKAGISSLRSKNQIPRTKNQITNKRQESNNKNPFRLEWL